MQQQAIQNYDLVIVGAGCVGVAAAYYAAEIHKKKVCLIQKSQIDCSQKRYWSSSFSARQNRVQYNQEYLTRFVVKSNQQWRSLQTKFNKQNQFLHRQGALWFGDKNVTTSQGNIKLSSAVLSQINQKAKKQKQKMNKQQDSQFEQNEEQNLQKTQKDKLSNKEDEEYKRIQYCFLDRLMEQSPQYLKAFKPYKRLKEDSSESQWDSWQALYQPDGGSVNMEESYTSLLQYCRKYENYKQYSPSQNLRIKQNDQKCQKNNYKYQIKICFKGQEKTLLTSKIFVATGIHTPFFLKQHFKIDHLVDEKNQPNKDEVVIQQYVASYFKIIKEKQNQKKNKQIFEIMSNLPNFINFFTGYQDNQSNQSSDLSGYGFRYHQWDNNHQKGQQYEGHYVKVGTMTNRILSYDQIIRGNSCQINDDSDKRVIQAKRYARERMRYLDTQNPGNIHLPCPIIFFTGRQTVLDYLNRRDKSVVVQSGGWVAKYYPLLAKTAMEMIFAPQHIDQIRKKPNHIIGNFINRTRFPVKKYITQQLQTKYNKYPIQNHFKTVVIGAGCAGLYSAYRLNQQINAEQQIENKKPQNQRKYQLKQRIGNIGLFELSNRISGRLKSFNFHNVATPMELGGMRYIEKSHILVNKVITKQGIPNTDFKMDGDPIQNYARRAYLRGNHSSVQAWDLAQSADLNFITDYKLQEQIVGMTSIQIITYSMYKLLKDPCNLKAVQKVVKNHGKRIQKVDKWNYKVKMTLKQWNDLKPILLFPQPYHQKIQENGIQKIIQKKNYFPLSSVGFQNVIESQFSHQTYNFVADHNGYYSITSNASYLDQVMSFLLDFGDVKYNTLIGGYDNLNYTMAHSLLDKETGIRKRNGGVYMLHKLVDIKKDDKKYVLTFHVPQIIKKIRDQQVTKTQKQKISCINKKNSQLQTDQQFEYQRKDAIQSKFKPLNHCKKGIYTNQCPKQEYGVFKQLKSNKRFYEIKFTAERIVLAMPRKSIENLYYQVDLFRQPIDTYQKYYKNDHQEYQEHIKDEILQDTKQNKIQIFKRNPPKQPQNLLQLAETTQARPSVKIVMNFKVNWWDPNERINKLYGKTYKNMNLVNSFHEMRGRSITDLPIRQTLYFSEAGDHLLLASYNDMVTTQYWNTLQSNFKQVWPPCKKCHRKQTVKYSQKQKIQQAKTPLVRQVLRQLSIIHNMKVQQQWLDQCVYQYWGSDPYGAGYHNFFAGYYVSAVMKAMRKPWKNQQIHFVGEAYSNQTGWVQGAFQTAQKLLTQGQFGVKLRPFVEKYYAGY